MKKFPPFPIFLKVAMAFAPLAFVGCVPYQTYETLKSDYTRLKSAHDDLVVKYNRAIQDILRAKGDQASLAALQEKYKNLDTLNKDLTAKLSKFGVNQFTPEELKKRNLPQDLIDEEGNLVLTEKILFNSGEAKLKSAEAEKILDGVVDLLQKEHANEIIHISGHTDNDPLVKTANIWKYQINLGYNRAFTVFQYFVQHGITEGRMVIHSFANLKPADPANQDTKEGKAKSRRVVIELGGTKI